jgi:chromosome segregation ATPase
LDSLREELAATKEQLGIAKEEMVADGAAHSDLQRRHAEEQEQRRDAAEQLRAEIKTLERRRDDVRAELENAVAGLRALREKIG